MFSRVKTLVCLCFALFATLAIQDAAFAQTPMAGVTALSSSSELGDASPVVSNVGLSPIAGGGFQLTTNRFTAEGLSMWASGSTATISPERNPLIQFNLGQTVTVDKFRVWNYNEPGFTARSFRDVTVQISNNGIQWHSVAQRFRFAQAPGTDTYTGEEFVFDYPITAQYIRFQADSNYGGQISGLSKVRFYAGGEETEAPSADFAFPLDAGIVNVQDAPYNAKGDGVTDDTAALQQAINDWQGTSQTIYLPAGTYLISSPLKLTPGIRFGYTNIRGESTETVILRLKDNTFTNPNLDQPVLDAAYNGTLPDANGNFFVSADWFNNNFGHFTIHTGTGNPGAVGLRFYSNNVGAVRNVTIVSGDRSGRVGLDLGYVEQNGPLYAKNIVVDGFNIGINCGSVINSQVLENITLCNQNVVGIRNGGQCLSINNLLVSAGVTAFDNGGVATLLNASLLPNDDSASSLPAIINGESLFARSSNAAGYGLSVRNNYDGTASLIGQEFGEYISHPILQLFGTRPRSLNLPIATTPDAPQDNPDDWANVRNFRLTTDPDDTQAVQRAIDSGATTVYFPGQGTYFLSSLVEVRGSTRRIIGMHSRILKAAPNAGLKIMPTAPARVWIEDLGNIGGSIDIVNASSKTLIALNLQDCTLKPQGTGNLFIENVAAPALQINGQSVWARQLNIEGSATKIVNSGGTLWILGMKSEDGGTLIETKNQGKTELIGGLYYSQRGSLNNAPMFINTESSVSLTVGEVNFANDPFQKLVEETRNGVTRTLLRGEAPFRRFVPGSMLPLYVGYDDPTFLAPPHNLKAANGLSNVALTWDVMPRATSYIVRRANTPKGPFTTIASNVTANSYTDSTVLDRRRYSYVVQAVYPTGTSRNSQVVTATVGRQYQINSGGSAVGSFAADGFFAGGNTASTGAGINTAGVVNAAPQWVYQTERWNNVITYTFPSLAPEKPYKVRLHFAEFVVNQPGQRVFNVTINGTPVLTNYDIIARVGELKAVVEEFMVTADAAGNLTVNFAAVVANPKISGIEILIP